MVVVLEDMATILNIFMRILDTTRRVYNKKIKEIKVCEFCNPTNIKKQACKNISSKYWLVFVNKYPYLDGNLMVIPRRHFVRVDEITAEEWIDLQDVIVRTQAVLTKLFKTKSFNLGLNIGKEAGASIEHMHWQVLPRKVENQTAMNLFADLHLVSMPPQELRRKIGKLR